MQIVLSDRKKKAAVPKYEVNKFTDYYNECLRCLQLTDKEGAQKYIIDNLTNKSEHKYHYYKACVDATIIIDCTKLPLFVPNVYSSATFIIYFTL